MSDQVQVYQPKKSSGAGSGLLLLVIALGLIIGPAFLGDQVDGVSKTIIMVFGVVMFLAGSSLITFTRLYHKAEANEAYVRTGVGGRKVLMDGGALVIPALHSKTPVNLETMRLEVKRDGQDALITGDNLRADVHAEFYIKVERDEESIIAAATSLGTKSMSPVAITELVGEKLVSALRTVAATMTLNELHTKRDDFASAVREALREDLRHNGLTLETVTVSHLDQTDPGRLKVDTNIFDAQGARRIAEITQAQRVERNKIERVSDQQVKEQDVQRDKFVFQQEVNRAESEAERNKKIQAALAASEVAEQERQREVELAGKTRLQQVGVAEQQRLQAEQQAEIARNQAVDVAERERQITIAQKEKERATAEASRLEAEAERQKQEQAVQTVAVTAEAERQKSKTVIGKQAEAESKKVEQQTAADVDAYRTLKSAEAERQSAEAKAQAQLQLARANVEAKKLAAEGDQAVQMVPVNVAAKQVEVEQQRVDVLRSELAAKSEHQEIAAELEVRIATITANKEAAIALAQAFGEALGNSKMTIWGDPTTFVRMAQSFTLGQSNGMYLQGLSESTPDGVKEAVSDGLNGIAKAGAGLLSKLTGQPVTEAQIEQLLRSQVKNNDQPGT